ncbi:MAG: tetratricopeptide repeat protein [Gemmataceae bacterium]
MRHLWILSFVAILALGFQAWADQKNQPQNHQKASQKSVEELAREARSSIVVVNFVGRDGQQQGLGTGFVVSSDGLIATNRHVIGDARPITVRLENGKEYPVQTVQASDRTLDLALLKIKAKGLKALDLADSNDLRNGQRIVALGHPRGLEFSVVGGVLSGRQKLLGQSMLQLAIPIESGNSGGPVLDAQGQVVGIVTLKSQVTRNLGFAVPVNSLKRLIRKPNPIPMSRWVTIGRINPDEWQTVFKGRWRQRNGHIVVDGPGEGFGGRSLCLSREKVPAVPFEIAVTLKLGDERGAGGLAFYSDEKNNHYGFYPSSGKLRFSRFLGPDVFSWKVLHESPSEHYRPGDWNTLKVRVQKDKISCFVNDHLVHESSDNRLTTGRVGLVKFRTSSLEFKNFRIGKKLASSRPSTKLVQRIEKLVTKLDGQKKAEPTVVDSLVPEGRASIAVLRAKAKLLEEQAKQLRLIAKAVHTKEVLNELGKITQLKDDEIPLLHGALLIAKLDNEELNVPVYIRQIDRLAKEVRKTWPKDATEADKLTALNKELFQMRGFHGSRGDYYNRANSYLNRVLEDREGIPITLSVLYIELAKRLGVNVVGVGLPGHFIVRHEPKKGPATLIDVYEGGAKLTKEDVAQIVKQATGEAMREGDLATVTRKAILVRMLHNLAGIALEEEDPRSVLKYYDAILTITPQATQERLRRAALRFQTGDPDGSIADLDWLLDNSTDDIDRDKLRNLRRFVNQRR